MGNSTGPRPNSDTDYGVVGEKTLRTAAQIGNETGAADFGEGQITGQTIRIVPAEGSIMSLGRDGVNFTVFGEGPAVPVNTETTLVQYVAPDKHTVRGAMCSGEADAIFTLKSGANIVARKRNCWTDRNVEFNFGDYGLKYEAGATISITVLSKGDSAQPFDATLFGEDL